MIESRKSPRHPVLQGAWIFPGGGSSLIPCMMLDLSDAGARMKLDPSTRLPAEFILVLSRDGRLNRRCRMIWREEDMIGVQFLARQSINPKTRRERPRGFEIAVPEPRWEDDAPATDADAPTLVPENAR